MSDHPPATAGIDDALTAATGRLVREFADTFGTDEVAEAVAMARATLEARNHPAESLAAFTESFAADELRAQARLRAGQSPRPSVLFLCVHNAGRSQMAAGYLRHLAGDRIEVFSGGSDPGTATNPVAIEAMAEEGIDIATQFPKPWTDGIARAADVIITMGCGDVCPVYPGKRYEDWELQDPAGQGIDMVRSVRDDIRRRVEGLIASLEGSAS